MKKKNIAWGVILIVFAVYYLLCQAEIIPDEFSTYKVIFTILFGFFAVKGLLDRSFSAFMVCLAVMGCINANLLGIEKITPIPLLLSFMLIGIGLDMIFKNFWKKDAVIGQTPDFDNSRVENVMDAEEIRLQNNFGSMSKYVNSNHFRYAKLQNNFGKCNVYFNNAILGSSQAQIEAKNAFGEMNLYFPSTWRVDVRQDVTIGEVKYKGVGSSNPDAPCVFVNIESSFGQVNICFE